MKADVVNFLTEHTYTLIVFICKKFLMYGNKKENVS
jgi:hypothetical protein